VFKGLRELHVVFCLLAEKNKEKKKKRRKKKWPRGYLSQVQTCLAGCTLQDFPGC
jgi:hypothetical protein